jgi:hypothetical protein
MHSGTTLRATDRHVAYTTSHDIIDIPFSMIDAVHDPTSRRYFHTAKTTTAA